MSTPSSNPPRIFGKSVTPPRFLTPWRVYSHRGVFTHTVAEEFLCLAVPTEAEQDRREYVRTNHATRVLHAEDVVVPRLHMLLYIVNIMFAPPPTVLSVQTPNSSNAQFAFCANAHCAQHADVKLYTRSI